MYFVDDLTEIMSSKPPKTEEGKCFVACMSKEMGFVSILDI